MRVLKQLNCPPLSLGQIVQERAQTRTLPLLDGFPKYMTKFFTDRSHTSCMSLSNDGFGEYAVVIQVVGEFEKLRATAWYDLSTMVSSSKPKSFDVATMIIPEEVRQKFLQLMKTSEGPEAAFKLLRPYLATIHWVASNIAASIADPALWSQGRRPLNESIYLTQAHRNFAHLLAAQ